MEKDCVYEIKPEASDFNENLCMKPSAYQRIIGAVVEKHLIAENIAFGGLSQGELAWVMTSLNVEVKSAVNDFQSLFARTWYSQRRGPLFRREIIFCDANGDERFSGSIFSVLINMNTRKLFREKVLPFELRDPHEEFVTTNPSSAKELWDYKLVEKRKVYPSFIDFIGHVNNCKYGDFAYDALNKEQRVRLSDLQSLHMFFYSELSCDDEFAVFKGDSKNCIAVKGVKKASETACFEYILRVK